MRDGWRWLGNWRREWRIRRGCARFYDILWVRQRKGWEGDGCTGMGRRNSRYVVIHLTGCKLHEKRGNMILRVNLYVRSVYVSGLCNSIYHDHSFFSASPFFRSISFHLGGVLSVSCRTKKSRSLRRP